MARTREITCEYQPYIFQPPVPKKRLYQQACSNDEGTIAKWREPWLKNIKANKEKFGSFAESSVGQLFGQFLHRPVIIAGSGPSLKFNVAKLKDRGSIPLVSCLHNFHFMEDHDARPEYYVSLDAGEVTVDEVTEGGNPDRDYWELTKDRTLLAFIGSHPRLLEKWQGRVLFFNAPVPDPSYQAEVKEIEDFNLWVSNGGNVFGSCLYISKVVLGAGTIIFVGADFSFGYDKRFHSWGSKYDAKMGHVMPLTDVFGNKVATWPSYANFKAWFDYVTLNVPGHYINCSEGGCLGSYPEGNLFSIQQMDLEKCFEMYTQNEHIKAQCENPAEENRYIMF